MRTRESTHSDISTGGEAVALHGEPRSAQAHERREGKPMKTRHPAPRYTPPLIAFCVSMPCSQWACGSSSRGCGGATWSAVPRPRPRRRCPRAPSSQGTGSHWGNTQSPPAPPTAPAHRDQGTRTRSTRRTAALRASHHSGPTQEPPSPAQDCTGNGDTASPGP